MPQGPQKRWLQSFLTFHTWVEALRGIAQQSPGQFTLITNGHLAANNFERPAIYCVRKEIRNWNVYSFFTCFFSLESGILNITAVRGHGCHPEAVQHLKRIKLGMCMLYITCTVIFPSRCALDGHCMAPLGDTRPCECGLFIRDVCQLNFLPVC